MNPALIVPAARLVAGSATSICVGKVVREVVANNVNALSRPAQVQVYVGCAALSAVIGAGAAAQMENMVGVAAKQVLRFRRDKVEIID